MTTIAENIQVVQERIKDTCERSNRDFKTVKIIAVSKRKPMSDIQEAIDAGLQHFGENRVEESQEKIPQLRSDKTIIWHMIGHIQSRKAKHIAPLFQFVQSIDSVSIAEKLAKTIIDYEHKLDVLLQINISGEASKSGLNAYNWKTDASVQSRLLQDIQQILQLPCLNVCGLMTMAPIVNDIEQTRPIFADLAKLRDELQQSLSLSLPELSMGMTNDYSIAIEEGATMVRIGRAIFGERNN